jgi:excisionase family DNA binding protein
MCADSYARTGRGTDVSRHHYHGDSDSYRVPSTGSNGSGAASNPIEVVIQLLAAVLDSRSAALPAQSKGPEPMLTVGQAAALLGTSRATIIRKADAGELPCVVVSRGNRKKMRRFPQALIEDLALRAGGSMNTDLKQYTASWLASTASQSRQHAGPGLARDAPPTVDTRATEPRPKAHGDR